MGVQSFDDDLLKQMDRYEKYGSGDVILERIAEAEPPGPPPMHTTS